jgi:uncharacterized protein YegL
MPRVQADQTMENLQTPNAYTFSGVNADDLGASEYTLATIAEDVSGSVLGFSQEIINCLKTVLDACKHSPRSSNLMLRTALFDDDVREFFGFRMLPDIQKSEFDHVFSGAGGCTALYDSVHTSIDATLAYGKKLTENGISNNAIIFIVTDGMDNRSKYNPKEVKKLIAKATKDECVESVRVVLIGITDNNQDTNSYLENFKNEAGIDQYINIGKADANTLAKLADFISKSISSQSQSLNSGGPSQPIVW